jgi:hypothetical protein
MNFVSIQSELDDFILELAEFCLTDAARRTSAMNSLMTRVLATTTFHSVFFVEETYVYHVVAMAAPLKL